MQKLSRQLIKILVIFLSIPILFFTAMEASAVITYEGDIGTITSKTTGTSLVIPVGVTVEEGHDIIVAFATDGDPNYTISMTDSVGNSYEEVGQSVCYTHGRTYIFAAYDVNTLPSGGTITITHTSVAARAAVASEFNGLAEVNVLDQSLGNPAPDAQEQQSGTMPTVGPTGTTSQANELLIGAIGTEGPVGDAAGTWNFGFTAGPSAGTTGGDATSNWTVSLGYQIVSSTGAYTAQKSGITDRFWAASIATFKTENSLSSDSYNIVLGRPTNNSITINTIMEMDGEVSFEYGTAPGDYTAGQTSAQSATMGDPVETIIGALSSDTQYYYRIRYRAMSGDDWTSGAEHFFHTQRAPGEAFTFTIISDSHLGQTFSSNTPERYEQTTLNVAADLPDFNLDLGDAFIVSTDLGVGNNVNGNQSQVDAVYLGQRPYFGNFSHSASVFLALGNHENEEGWNFDDTPFSRAIAALTAQKEYFPNPIPDGFYSGNTDLLPSPVIGDNQYREDYYAWTWGDALFVVLDPFQYTMTKPYGNVTGSGEDSPEDEVVSGDQWNWTLGEQQFNWFKQTLQNSNAKFKFVFSHHVVGGQLNVSGSSGVPEYVRGGALAADYFEWGGQNSNGSYGFGTQRSGWGDNPIHQLMINYGVSAFFHGHDHQFVHEVIDDIVYQLAPSAGMTGTGFNLYASSPYVVNGGNLPSPGHLRVTVSPTQTLVEYVRSAVSGDTGVTNGEVAYSYTIDAPEPQLYGDIEPEAGDCDVDGRDLAEWVVIGGIDLSLFADNFGKNACP
jgi:hypothetical protein